MNTSGVHAHYCDSGTAEQLETEDDKSRVHCNDSVFGSTHVATLTNSHLKQHVTFPPSTTAERDIEVSRGHAKDHVSVNVLFPYSFPTQPSRSLPYPVPSEASPVVVQASKPLQQCSTASNHIHSCATGLSRQAHAQCALDVITPDELHSILHDGSSSTPLSRCVPLLFDCRPRMFFDKARINSAIHTPLCPQSLKLSFEISQETAAQYLREFEVKVDAHFVCFFKQRIDRHVVVYDRYRKSIHARNCHVKGL